MTITTTMRWPAISRTPRAPLHAPVARGIFERAVHMVPVRVTTPDGRVLGGDTSSAAPEFRIVRPSAFFARLGRDTKVGFGESYMAGDWRAGDGTDLADLLTPFAARLTTLVPQPLQRLRAVVDKRPPKHHENTLEGSRENIQGALRPQQRPVRRVPRPTMSYSSAWFPEDADLLEAVDLEAAQLRKIDGILDYADVRENSASSRSVRAGGAGHPCRPAWRAGHHRDHLPGAARPGHQARRRGGVADRVDLRLQDYREVEGEFDAIVSVEMVEAVGEEYWPTYFASIDRLLAPGGRVSIQAITMAHNRMLATRRSLVDPEVHLPRRAHPVPAGHRRDAGRAHLVGGQPAPRAGPPPRERSISGATGSTRTGPRSTRRVSTRPSGGCGSSTQPTARRGSGPDTSGSASSRSRDDRYGAERRSVTNAAIPAIPGPGNRPECGICLHGRA